LISRSHFITMLQNPPDKKKAVSTAQFKPLTAPVDLVKLKRHKERVTNEWCTGQQRMVKVAYEQSRVNNQTEATRRQMLAKLRKFRGVTQPHASQPQIEDVPALHHTSHPADLEGRSASLGDSHSLGRSQMSRTSQQHTTSEVSESLQILAPPPPPEYAGGRRRSTSVGIGIMDMPDRRPSTTPLALPSVLSSSDLSANGGGVSTTQIPHHQGMSLVTVDPNASGATDISKLRARTPGESVTSRPRALSPQKLRPASQQSRRKEEAHILEARRVHFEQKIADKEAIALRTLELRRAEAAERSRERRVKAAAVREASQKMQQSAEFRRLVLLRKLRMQEERNDSRNLLFQQHAENVRKARALRQVLDHQTKDLMHRSHVVVDKAIFQQELSYQSDLAVQRREKEASRAHLLQILEQEETLIKKWQVAAGIIDEDRKEEARSPSPGSATHSPARRRTFEFAKFV
jgi:hypothetical protein